MAAPAKYVIPGAIAEEPSDCEESHDDVGFALPMASSSPRQAHHPRQRPSMYAFSYRTMFLACLANNEPEKAVDIVTIAHGAEWNFLYQETGLSPLCAVVDPAASELDPRAMHAVVDALVAHGARLDWPPSSPSLQASRFHIAFVAVRAPLVRSNVAASSLTAAPGVLWDPRRRRARPGPGVPGQRHVAGPR